MINLSSGGQNNHADISIVIYDIFHSFTTLKYSFGFAPRDNNSAAHVLACRALFNGASNRWDGHIPYWLKWLYPLTFIQFIYHSFFLEKKNILVYGHFLFQNFNTTVRSKSKAIENGDANLYCNGIQISNDTKLQLELVKLLRI